MKLKWTYAVLMVSVFWVFYVATFSETILYYDAWGYEELGRGLTQAPFSEYLRHGPTREPLYPLFVALNMRLSDLLHIPYTNLLLCTQVLLLLMTQIGLAFIFISLGVPDLICAGLLLYFIISPAVLRSSLIVYSEIFTYVPMLAALFVVWRSWIFLMDKGRSWSRYLKRGAFTGMVFLPMIFVKGVFELVTPAILSVIFFWAVWRWRQDPAMFKRVTVFFLAANFVFFCPVLLYKTANLVYNGKFAFTDRGAWALYGTAARRALPVTPQEDLAQKLYVFSDKSFCDRWASASACAHWHYGLSDQLGYGKLHELSSSGLSPSQVDSRLLGLSLDIFRQHPWAMVKGMFWEGAKLLFWEYPLWGMVVLPQEFDRFYQQSWVYYSVIFIVNFVTVALFFWGIGHMAVHFRRLDNPDETGRRVSLVFAALVFILAYAVAHSFFFLNERNALPLVPVYFVLCGAALRVLFREQR